MQHTGGAGGGMDKYTIHIKVSSLRKVKLALVRPKKFSSGITSILILNKGVVTTKTLRERNSEIRETAFLQKSSAKRARTTFSLYQDVCKDITRHRGTETNVSSRGL